MFLLSPLFGCDLRRTCICPMCFRALCRCLLFLIYVLYSCFFFGLSTLRSKALLLLCYSASFGNAHGLLETCVSSAFTFPFKTLLFLDILVVY